MKKRPKDALHIFLLGGTPMGAVPDFCSLRPDPTTCCKQYWDSIDLTPSLVDREQCQTIVFTEEVLFFLRN